MDDKWRITICGQCCAGIKWSFGDEGPIECDCGGGVIYLRPKGHAFAWPGGPAVGWYSEERYEKGKPVMPWHWHDWKETEDEIAALPIDQFGSIDKASIVHCTCGWEGTIADNDTHVKEMETEFINSHK